MEKPHQGAIEIAGVMMGPFRPEEISLEVDGENVILHAQHHYEQEDGFEHFEFKKAFKIPPGVDPTTVALHFHPQDGSVHILAGPKHVEDKANDGKFEAHLDFSGFKPERFKLQVCGNVLTVTGVRHQSRNTYSRCIVLPDDVDPKSVTSSSSKEGLLTIKASRDPAKLSHKGSDEITITRETNEQPKEKTTIVDASGTAI